MWKLTILQEKNFSDGKGTYNVDVIFTSSSFEKILNIVSMLDELTSAGNVAYKIERIEEKAGDK